jgi:hypothetical protein
MSTQIIRCDFPDSFLLGGGKRFIWFIILSKTGIKTTAEINGSRKYNPNLNFIFIPLTG